jgi:trehalose 6-phosphate phosphatase
LSNFSKHLSENSRSSAFLVRSETAHARKSDFTKFRMGSKDELDRWMAHADRLWLFLDYDGTLAEFALTPEQVKPNPQIIELITRLSHHPRIRLAIVSGQGLSSLQTLLPVPGIFLAGSYGIELQTPSGKMVYQVEKEGIRTTLDEIKARWMDIIAGRKGFYLEDKGFSLALHARFAEELEAEQALYAARKVAESQQPMSHLRILGGHKFLEVAPLQANKGKTVSYLLQNFPWPAARLVYVGDDDKDQEAFSVIQSLGGVAILVLNENELASFTNFDHVFASPQAVRAWLKTLMG